MKEGIIYPIAHFIAEKLDRLNLVELFKFAARKLNRDRNNQDRERMFMRIAVDIFIFAKFLFLGAIWLFNVSNLWITIVVWYLLVTNVYTYFYRHIWCDDAFDPRYFTKERQRRRFINLFLAFTYSNLSFAFLYFLPYAKHMNWGEGMGISGLHALWFSMSNSVAANYAVVSPLDGIGNTVAMIQLVITFFFVTIIISRSIPQTT